MNLRTIIRNEDGLAYVRVATSPTVTQKIETFGNRLAEIIDRVLYKTDISHLPVPNNRQVN